MKKKILVTGGAGFIGSNFCNINENKYDLIVLDNLFLGSKDNLNPGIKFVEGDARSLSDLNKIGGVDYVLHLAGASSAPMFVGEGFIDSYMNSIKSFLNVLEWSKKNGVKKVLYASTSSLYGNNSLPLKEDQNIVPPNHYSVTKLAYEHIAKCFNKVYPKMDVIGFRFMSVYGLNEESKGVYANLVSQFIWDIARGFSPVIYGDGSQTRDFTNVRDVVEGIVLGIESSKKLGATVFNVGTGRATSLNELVRVLEKLFDNGIGSKYVKNPITEDYIIGQYASISKISSVLGYAPKVDLETGIREVIENLNLERVKKTSSDSFR